MQLHVKGKNLEVSDSIRDYAERKLAKLEKTLHPTTRVEVELTVERNPSAPMSTSPSAVPPSLKWATTLRSLCSNAVRPRPR